MGNVKIAHNRFKTPLGVPMYAFGKAFGCLAPILNNFSDSLGRFEEGFAKTKNRRDDICSLLK